MLPSHALSLTSLSTTMMKLGTGRVPLMPLSFGPANLVNQRKNSEVVLPPLSLLVVQLATS